ncbi:MAG: hypothetical protein ACI8Y4_000230 [Candidatus Poriferisodalaceae bacterium]|jgi:hypothetical protein
MTDLAAPSVGSSPPPASLGPPRLRLNTPRLLRIWSLVTIGVATAVAIVAFVSAVSLTSRTNRLVNNTGPVLVSTQDTKASVAEADAASTAVFLSGPDIDREQQRLYELSVQRSTSEIEEVARLIGDDELAHASLKITSAQLVLYAGQVEAALLANQQSIAGAEERLESALSTVRDGILPEIDVITARAEQRFGDDTSGSTEAILILLPIAIAAAVIFFAMGVVRRRSNRVLNLPMTLGFVLLLIFGLWTATAINRRSNALNDARSGGFDAIALTARIQNAGFSYKTAETVGLIDGTGAGNLDSLGSVLAAGPVTRRSDELSQPDQGTNTGLLVDAYDGADSDRERAAAVELVIRWNRYVATSEAIAGRLANGDVLGARTLAATSGNVDFNGFNTAVESVLSDNRTQFTTSVGDASHALRGLRTASIVIPMLAALLAARGFQTRINEYR